MERTVQERRLALKVGLFAIIGILIVAYMSIRVGEIPLRERRNRITVYAQFDSVAGLDEKADVRMAGVVIGRVTRIFLQNGKAMVEVSVERSAGLRTDAKARISTLSMVGGNYLEFKPVSSTAPLAQDGTIFKGELRPGFPELAASTTNLMGKLSLVADDIKAVSESLKNVIGTEKGQKQLDAMLDKLDRAVSGISDMVEQNRQNLDEAVAALKQFAQTLREVTPRIVEKVEKITDRADNLVSGSKSDIQDAIHSLRSATRKLDEVLSNVESITRDIKSGKGTIGKLVTQDTVHKELSQTLKEFGDTLNSAKKLIGGFERIHTFLGYRGEYLTETSEYKNYVTLKIQPGKKKYFLLEVSNSPYGTERTYERYKETQTSIEEGGLVRLVKTKKSTSERTTEKKPLFTLQYARRFGPVTLRGGITESEGGVGADLGLMGDRLTFSLDAWDFSNTRYEAHLKFNTKYQVYSVFFLDLGVDDLLNEERRSFYAGLGVLFSEEDLKYIIGSMPMPSW